MRSPTFYLKPQTKSVVFFCLGTVTGFAALTGKSEAFLFKGG